MKFEWYVLNEKFNRKEITLFNIFDNYLVQESVEKEIRKYLRSSKKYCHTTFSGEIYYGFEAFCKRIESIIMWQEWGRCEYEIAVGSLFTPEVHDVLKDTEDFTTVEEYKEYLSRVDSKTQRLQKIDCYDQVKNNIPALCREIIWQYKEQRKLKDNKNE